MELKVGTFNLNNLFSRFNFMGEVEAIADGETTVNARVEYNFTNGDVFRLRTFRGRLVKAKPPRDVLAIVDRITQMDLDVIAVQEIEDIDTLREFARNHLKGLYPFQVLIEGNDPRLIDLGVLSRLPIGAVTSWQHVVHPSCPERPVFGRDLLEVEVLDYDRSDVLFTIYNNHLKSHYVPFDQDPIEGSKLANERRLQQAEMIAAILKARMQDDSSFILLGDMNDPPDSEWLEPIVTSPLGLVDALRNPNETRPAKQDDPSPTSAAWTHRYKPAGQPARYELYDHLWLSKPLADRFNEAWIDRRTKHGGDGSDHDPAWVVLDI